jgi:hypothetical protein
MFLLSKFYGWLIAAGSILLALAGAIFYGWEKGRGQVKAAVATAQAQQKVNTAQAVISRVEVRQNVDQEVAQLPQSPPVAVTVPSSLPVPGSAADELRKQWSRD